MMYNDFNMLEMDAKSIGRREGKQEGLLLGKQEGLEEGKRWVIMQKEQDDKIIAQQKAYIMQKDDYIRMLEEKLKIQKV